MPCQSCPGQRLTPLQELPANPSMQTSAGHRVERRLCDAQSAARRDYTWSSTVPNGKSRYYCLWHTADYHAKMPCPRARHTTRALTLLAALSISKCCPPSQQLACAGCCDASSACPFFAKPMPSAVLQQ